MSNFYIRSTIFYYIYVYILFQKINNILKTMALNLKGIVAVTLCLAYDMEGSLKLNDMRNHLGTRTPYRFRFNQNDSKITYPNCNDTKIWMIVRHGTRFPSAKDIIGMNSTLNNLKYDILRQHKFGKGELTQEQLNELEDWTNNINLERAKYLTHEGEEEMTVLAKRIKKRFPNIIKEKYSNETFQVHYTATQRALQSAIFFMVGLFGPNHGKDVFAPAKKVDLLLRFYKHCDKWQKQVKKNPMTYEEQRLFGNNGEMKSALQSITKRLGLSTDLSLDEVQLMYKICGYETSWHKHKISPWCYGFNQTSIEILEYYFELKHYWLDGYGHDLNYRQACLSLKHMFDNFSHNKGPSATFLFTHSGFLLKVLSHLQLYRPSTHLRADSIRTGRAWRVSEIDCFGSNLAFVLFQCDNGPHVLTLHQERVIRLPMCEHDLCPLGDLKRHFAESIHNCDYTDICSLRKKEEL